MTFDLGHAIIKTLLGNSSHTLKHHQIKLNRIPNNTVSLFKENPSSNTIILIIRGKSSGKNEEHTCRCGHAASNVGSSSSGSNSAPLGFEDGGNARKRFTENYKTMYILSCTTPRNTHFVMRNTLTKTITAG